MDGIVLQKRSKYNDQIEKCKHLLSKNGSAMNILVVLGSPRKNGNSEIAAQQVAETILESHPGSIEYFRLSSHKISPCIACGGCSETGQCVIKDDMGAGYQSLDDADLVILAAPIYFYGLSAQAKAFIDRCQARWSRKYLLKKQIRPGETRRGCLVCTAATQGKKLFDGAILVAKSFFDTLDIDYGGELLIRGVDEKGAILGDSEKLQQAKEFARHLARTYDS